MAVTTTVRDLVHVARDRDIPFLAAAIAHYTLASLVPLLLLAVSLAAFVGSEAAIESFVRNRLGSVLSESGQQVVTGALASTEGAVGAGIVSILLAFWSGSKVFRGFDVAFNRIYGWESTPSLFEQIRDATIVIGLLAVGVAAMIVIGVASTLVDLPVPFPTLIGTVLLLLGLMVILLPIYYVLTPTDPSITDVLPGTVLGAVGLVVLQVAFVYYSRFAGRYEALGLLGALLLFIIWLYFGGIIVLLGGALNYVTGDPTTERPE
jgi:membrane protein